MLLLFEQRKQSEFSSACKAEERAKFSRPGGDNN
jgi:hypothetical protein